MSAVEVHIVFGYQYKVMILWAIDNGVLQGFAFGKVSNAMHIDNEGIRYNVSQPLAMK